MTRKTIGAFAPADELARRHGWTEEPAAGIAYLNFGSVQVNGGLLARPNSGSDRRSRAILEGTRGRCIAEIRNAGSGNTENIGWSRGTQAVLQEAIILYTGVHAYSRDDWITVLPLDRLWAPGDLPERPAP